jgi:hypothetical protein
MDWILQHWQSIAAALVVAATALVFGRRLLKRPERTGCGKGCGCPATPYSLRKRRK